jgi:hypothetical protein
MTNINSDSGTVKVDGHPNNCPFCHKTITPTFVSGHRNENIMEVLLICPNQECKKSFIGYYDLDVSNQVFSFNGKTTVGNLIGKEFSETIKTISENFTLIYNQAFAAEQQELTEICGVGFRKALEFLIKDYIIINKPEDKDKVEKKLLGSCIEEYVDDDRVKLVAKRAVWLGNDETHYIRKWEGKNLNDLKSLINLTIHWIEMEALTKNFEAEMPE